MVSMHHPRLERRYLFERQICCTQRGGNRILRISKRYHLKSFKMNK